MTGTSGRAGRRAGHHLPAVPGAVTDTACLSSSACQWPAGRRRPGLIILVIIPVIVFFRPASQVSAEEEVRRMKTTTRTTTRTMNLLEASREAGSTRCSTRCGAAREAWDFPKIRNRAISLCEGRFYRRHLWRQTPAAQSSRVSGLYRRSNGLRYGRSPVISCHVAPRSRVS